jgi:hypothetical protein
MFGTRTAIFVLLATVSGCVRPAPSDTGAPAQPVAASSAAAPGATVALDPRVQGWDLGKRYTYRLKLTTSVSFGEGDAAFDFDVTGNVRFTSAMVTPQVATLYFTIGDAQITSRVPSPSAFESTAAEIRKADAFVVLTGGRVTEMRLPSELSPMAANTYRAIASAIQFARASDGASRYTAEEYDTTGQYEAEYERSGEPNSWHKRKQRYFGLLAAKHLSTNVPAQIIPEVAASSGQVRLSADGRPDVVEIADEVLVNGAQAPVRSKTVVSLRSTEIDSATEPQSGWDVIFNSKVRIASDEAYGGAAPVAALDDARINGTTFAKVIARLEDIARHRGAPRTTGPTNGQQPQPDDQAVREKAVQEDLQLFEALSAIFRRQPETIAEAVRKIRAKSPLSGELLDALGSASTAASQSALVDIAQSKAFDPTVRSRATHALARSSNPEAKTIDALKAMLVDDPFNSKSLFGLGTFSRRLRDGGHAAEAEDLGKFLVARLKLATGELSTIIALRAIANSGYDGALPFVLPRLHHDDEEVRVAAVRSLQSMRDSRIDETLASILESDSSGSVRKATIESAAVREPSDVFARALATVATSDADPHVRYRAVELMVQWMTRRPDFRAALEQIATSDEEGQVREVAKAAL